MPDNTRDIQLLVLIEENIRAQRLIVTWPKAYFDYGDRMQVPYPGDLGDDDPLTLEWSRISGVDQDDVVRLAPVLFENGLLRPDGTIHETAEAYLIRRGLDIISA